MLKNQYLFAFISIFDYICMQKYNKILDVQNLFIKILILLAHFNIIHD